MPSGDKKVRTAYYRQVIDNNNTFIERNRILFTYYKTGRNSDDELMFLRNSDCHPLLLEYPGDIDTSFCTISSSILSKLIAFEQINNYLSEQIEKLKFGENITNNGFAANGNTENPGKIKYIGKKAGLHEVIMAMHENGDFGDVPLNRVMEVFENALNVHLGNYYSSLTDLAMRKKSKTPYLSTLIKALERKLERKLEAL